MSRDIPERDWKYMRKAQEELLAALFGRINRQSMDILAATGQSEADKYRRLYRHLKDSNRIVADCFDDWSRSTLFAKLFQLKQHDLLGPEHMENLSEETRARIEALEGLRRGYAGEGETNT